MVDSMQQTASTRRFRTLKVMHDRDSDYMVNVNAPGSVKAFTFKTYQRTCATDIQYQGKVTVAVFYKGV